MNTKVSMTNFAERAKSSLSQQTYAILVVSLFRHLLIHCVAFYFRAPFALPQNFQGAHRCFCPVGAEHPASGATVLLLRDV